MKRMVTIVLTAAFVLPLFALTTGDEFGYATTKKSSIATITSVLPTDNNGNYELSLNADGITYKYLVKEGSKIDVFAKAAKKMDNPKRTVTVKSVEPNSITVGIPVSEIDAK